MSVSMYSSRVNQYTRELSNLQLKLSQESKVEANETQRLNRAAAAASKATSASSLHSRLSEVERFQRDVARSQEKQARLRSSIADKQISLNTARESLRKAEQVEAKAEQRRIDEAQRRSARDALAHQRQITQELLRQKQISQEGPLSDGVGRTVQAPERFDVFISHASEDKEDFVRPLARELIDRGLRVWYDEATLKWGDSLRKKIDEGLRHSRFGIVVISPNFMSKNWTQYELDGLVAREMNGSGDTVILPIWHRVSKDEVMNFSPTLANTLAKNTSVSSIVEIADEIQSMFDSTEVDSGESSPDGTAIDEVDPS